MLQPRKSSSEKPLPYQDLKGQDGELHWDPEEKRHSSYGSCPQTPTILSPQLEYFNGWTIQTLVDKGVYDTVSSVSAKIVVVEGLIGDRGGSHKDGSARPPQRDHRLQRRSAHGRGLAGTSSYKRSNPPAISFYLWLQLSHSRQRASFIEAHGVKATVFSAKNGAQLVTYLFIFLLSWIYGEAFQRLPARVPTQCVEQLLQRGDGKMTWVQEFKDSLNNTARPPSLKEDSTHHLSYLGFLHIFDSQQLTTMNPEANTRI